jgi:hypothetical protein
MEMVTTIKPLWTWAKYPELLDDQQEFLKKELAEGRLSKKRMGNGVILSDNETGFYNPLLTDGTMLYFVDEESALTFASQQTSKLHRNFYPAWLYSKKCNCKSAKKIGN